MGPVGIALGEYSDSCYGTKVVILTTHARDLAPHDDLPGRHTSKDQRRWPTTAAGMHAALAAAQARSLFLERAVSLLSGEYQFEFGPTLLAIAGHDFATVNSDKILHYR
jgi:hypothetical protein